jgi:uncharacterized delta-60 repeat protein
MNVHLLMILNALNHKQISNKYLKIFFMKIILNTLVFILAVYTAKAQSGSLDNSFGEGGKVLNQSLNSTCSEIALQKDGKIVTAGAGRDETTGEYGFLVARFNIDGSLDESFGNEGRVILNNLEGVAVVNLSALSIQPDGKILVAGSVKNPNTYSDIVVLRLNSDGSFDNSFDDNGIAIYDLSYKDLPTEMLVQPDGKILVGGTRQNAQSGFLSWFTIRYLTDGNIDKNFGDGGVVFTEFITATELSGIIIQPDDKIIIGGSYSSFSRTYILVRYLSNGIVDSSFGESGIAKLRLADVDQNYGAVADIALEPDGKIVTTGSGGAQNFRISVARFASDGSVDSSFGINGYTILPMERGYSRGQTVKVMPDKKIIVTGIYIDGPSTGFAAAKFNDDGTFDSSFGESGLAVTGFDVFDAGAETGIVQEDGKIIVAGSAYPEDDLLPIQIAMVRFNNSINDSVKPLYVRIKKWLHRHGFTWDDWPGKNINYYSVQRSGNGSAFNEIARLFNRNNSAIAEQYSYEDAASLSGSNYYRLAAVSADGSTAYSNIIAIDNNVNTVKIYPNPVRNALQVEGLPATEKTKLTITDFSGNTRMSVQITGKNYNWNISQLRQGNYILKVESKGMIVTKKFVKE